MMNRLRWPLAQICQRASAKPSQPRKAMTPGTKGRFNLDHMDGVGCPRDLSSSDVEVSCNREPPPWLSQREGQFLARRAQLTRVTPYAVTARNEHTETEGRGGCRDEKRDAGEVLRAAFLGARGRVAGVRIRPGGHRPPPARLGRGRAGR